MSDKDLPSVTAYFRSGGLSSVLDATEIDFRATIVVVSSKADGIHVFPLGALEHLHVDGDVEMRERH